MGNDITEQKLNALPLEKEATIALFALVEALSFEVLSSDVWWLANNTARKIAVQKYGISEETYSEVMEKIEKARLIERQKNPLSSMF